MSLALLSRLLRIYRKNADPRIQLRLSTHANTTRPIIYKQVLLSRVQLRA